MMVRLFLVWLLLFVFLLVPGVLSLVDLEDSVLDGGGDFDLGNEGGVVSRLESDLLSLEEDLSLLVDQDIPVGRFSSLLNSSWNLFGAQRALEGAGGVPDFDLVSQRVLELRELRDVAVLSHDELLALESVVGDFSQDDGLLQNFLGTARNEFETERFELVLEEVDKAYIRMSELEAFDTKLRAAYDATSRNIVGFLYGVRFYLFGFLLFLFLFFIFARKYVLRFRVRRKIRDLEFRRRVINDLMANIQKEYFENNSLSESNYHVRSKKYGELIRDLNRQRPILEERLAMLGGKKKGMR